MLAIVRPATEDDLPRIVELLQQLSFDDRREDIGPPLPDVYLNAFRQLQADPGQHLLVVEDDGRIVGSVTVIVCPNLSHKGTPWAEVENMIVDDAARGRGHGEALIREAIEIARRAGCYKLTLTSNNKRTDAHRFYERVGFKQTHRGFRISL
ncbi:MAG: GNAT family N-acetyltransferase [Chloroflexi bacterium]|nr:GNAT family N-acetyltransferase [Chloroflexota bacterium]